MELIADDSQSSDINVQAVSLLAREALADLLEYLRLRAAAMKRDTPHLTQPNAQIDAQSAGNVARRLRIITLLERLDEAAPAPGEPLGMAAIETLGALVGAKGPAPDSPLEASLRVRLGRALECLQAGQRAPVWRQPPR